MYAVVNWIQIFWIRLILQARRNLLLSVCDELDVFSLHKFHVNIKKEPTSETALMDDMSKLNVLVCFPTAQCGQMNQDPCRNNPTFVCRFSFASQGCVVPFQCPWKNNEAILHQVMNSMSLGQTQVSIVLGTVWKQRHRSISLSRTLFSTNRLWHDLE